MLDGGEGSRNQQQLDEFATQLSNNDSTKRNAKKSRDKMIYQCIECSFYTHRRGNLTRHMNVCNSCIL